MSITEKELEHLAVLSKLKLSPEEKKKQLYLNQKQTLEAFLERGAISQAQFDKSLGDLTIKMGMNISGK